MKSKVSTNRWDTLYFRTVEEYLEICFIFTVRFLTFLDSWGIFLDLLYLYCKISDIDKTDSFWNWQEKPNQYSDQIVRWPQNSKKIFDQNSFETLQEFRSEFWGLVLVSNHSNDFWVLEELDDHRILVKFFKDLITSRISWLQNIYEILQGFRAEF